MDVVVTVGMGRWPFDRLLGAVLPLCSDHRVFAQTGTSQLRLPCEHAPYVPYPELLDRIGAADVVVTHAGNTVRLVQRMGKVPVAVARTSALGEMANDHQVDYLRDEQRHGRVVAVWDVDQLPEAVQEHPDAEARLAARPLPPPADPAAVADRLDELWRDLLRNPFRRHPLHRYAYAWQELAAVEGPHLDVGCRGGDFLATLAGTTGRACAGVDPHPGCVRDARHRHPLLDVTRAAVGEPLPYPDRSFGSVSLLDVLERCPSEDDLLGEVRRVLRPAGVLVLTVPARPAFSWFGGLLGDMSPGKRERPDYRPDRLADRIRAHGFEITRESGANLFWRPFHGPSLLAGDRLRAPLERAIWLDGKLFSSANLFLTARRLP
jgi:SAM-dependent methyltransferase/UDP-N-acetylglucosamine transferase subunit ALG13